MRSTLRGMYSKLLRRRAAQGSDPGAARPALIFAPHPDDETLGCGGTIIRRRRAGSRVSVVVMTDGRLANSHLMEPERITAIRAAEVQAACATLGVPADDVLLLGLPDGQLSLRRADAIERVAAILGERGPADLFIPSRLDAHPDHQATGAIVLEAVRRCGGGATIYEYPVWSWYHWPWVRLPGRGERGMRGMIRRSAQGALGLRLLFEINCATPVQEQLPLKLAALQAHASQMTRLAPDATWITLPDIAGGDFLACLLGEHEYFKRWFL